MMQDTFCILPFIAVNMNTDGNVNFCCKNTYHAIGNNKTDSIEQVWNNDKIKEVRKTFLRNEKHHSCTKCWKVEDAGGNSYRHDANRYYGKFKETALDKVNLTTGEMPFEVKFMEIKLSSLCNLACKMCIPTVSTTLSSVWDSEMTHILSRQRVEESKSIQESFSSFEVFLDEIRKLAPHLSILSLAGGEPLMDERFVDVFKALGNHRRHISLSVITNLSKLKHGRFDIIPELKAFKYVGLVVSVDGTPKVTEYIRTFSNATNVENNLRTIREQVPGTMVTINSAVSALNVLDFVNAIKYYVNVLKTDLWSISNVDNFHMSLNILPFPIRQQAIENIECFLKTDFLSLNCTQALKERILQLSVAIINLLKSPYRDERGWAEFKQYITHFDKKCNSNVFDIVPELKEYWDV